jgi:alpha-tubulin suppressor-like RCC1 family protein
MSVALRVNAAGAPLFNAVSLTAGRSHTCALAADGQAFCWGLNNGFQLGDGTAVDRLSPVPSAGTLRFTQMQATDDMTCGLTAGGSVYCWGTGILGDGITSVSSAPVRVALNEPLATLLRSAATIRASAYPCGLTADGRVFCWGDYSRYLGGVPLLASGGFSFVEFTPSCALDGQGTVYCGTNGAYEAMPGPSLHSLASGYWHTCGLDVAGRAYCWGGNTFGELGDGTTTERPIPVPVETDLRFVRIIAHDRSTCAVTQQQEWYCWGLVELAGRAVFFQSLVPQRFPVSGLHFDDLAFGFQHLCGIAHEGGAYCWGENRDGQLGDGTRSVRDAPVPVRSP